MKTAIIVVVFAFVISPAAQAQFPDSLLISSYQPAQSINISGIKLISEQKPKKFKNLVMWADKRLVLINKNGNVLSEVLDGEAVSDTSKRLMEMGVYDYHLPEFEDGVKMKVNTLYNSRPSIYVLWYIDDDGSGLYTRDEIVKALPRGYKPVPLTDLLIYGQLYSMQGDPHTIVALGERKVFVGYERNSILYPRIDRRCSFRNLSWQWDNVFTYRDAILTVKVGTFEIN